MVHRAIGVLLAGGVMAAFFGSAADASSLRFFGNGTGDIDRVKIRIDDPANSLPGPPADIGATDFTIELWVKGALAENGAAAISCGSDVGWINGNIVLDRDRFNQDRKFGLSLGAGRPVFGVSGNGTGDRTVCATSSVLDGQWHHVAIQRRRSDGRMDLYVDGALEASADGPDGDISYPDDGVPGNFCGGPCTGSDPFLVIAAEKHDAGAAFPSFSGFVDEIRISTVLRYAAPFVRPTQPFVPDAATAALYPLDEGSGTVAGDTSGASGGPSPGELRVGGTPVGPIWSADTPFPAAPAALRFFTATPCRAADSRNGAPLLSGMAREFPLGGVCGIPAGARAVSLNLTAIAPTGPGHLTAHPSGESAPAASTLNFSAGAVRTNNSIVRLSSGGSLTLSPFVAGGGQVHVVIDVNGWFE